MKNNSQTTGPRLRNDRIAGPQRPGWLGATSQFFALRNPNYHVTALFFALVRWIYINNVYLCHQVSDIAHEMHMQMWGKKTSAEVPV